MIDWTSSMQQTFQYYKVEPISWKETEKIENINSCSISWDASKDTLGSASFEIIGDLEECYVRPYLVANQNGSSEKFSLGTFLVQPASRKFSSNVKTRTVNGYTPLIELKETYPEIGYTVHKGLNIMDQVYELTAAHMRGPVVRPYCEETLQDNFPAKSNETWCEFVINLMSSVNYSFSLDELNRVLFAPYQRTTTLMPVWTFNDDNSSILGSSIEMTEDIYGIPNVVEVVYSGSSGYYYSVVKNDDEQNPLSIPRRGREIQQRITNPELSGTPSQAIIDQYANRTIEELASYQKTVTYTHGFTPLVRLNDCVRLNYTRADVQDVKARVTAQQITCTTGIEVQETATYTESFSGNLII